MSEAKSFEQILEEDGVLVYTSKGFSMYPLIKQNRDLLVIRKPEGELKKYDIVLFKVKTKYLLHRIIEMDGDTIVTAGDHNAFKDSRIRKDRVIGVLSAIVRDGKEIDIHDPKLELYGKLVSDFFEVKAFGLKTKALGGKIKRKIFG
ncbi:MAG: S24/S26 family peptidase [Erysipelotrichaceae bacterium]|nr:S24/S26 family peptidase [Erysipelotrichaceae bacterium]